MAHVRIQHKISSNFQQMTIIYLTKNGVTMCMCAHVISICSQRRQRRQSTTKNIHILYGKNDFVIQKSDSNWNAAGCLSYTHECVCAYDFWIFDEWMRARSRACQARKWNYAKIPMACSVSGFNLLDSFKTVGILIL